MIRILLFAVLLLGCKPTLPEGVEVVTFGPDEVKPLPDIVAVDSKEMEKLGG